MMGGTLAILSGQAPDLAGEEVQTLARSLGWVGSAHTLPPRLLLLEPALEPSTIVQAALRLGLTHRLVQLWTRGPFDGTSQSLPISIPLPHGSFSVRIERLSGVWPDLDIPALQRRLGDRWGERTVHKVELENPDTEVRVVLQGDEAYIGATAAAIERSPFADRHVRNRPFFRPISLEPSVARALVTLSGSGPNSVLLDPCCGTGGFLLEAASSGIPCIGADIDPRMVEGARTNLSHLGLEALALIECPLGQLSERLGAQRLAVGGMVTDLPYGRSSALFGSTPSEVCAQVLGVALEVLSPGGMAVLVSPQEIVGAALPSGLVVVDRFAIRAHKSLTRHIVRLRHDASTR